MSDAETIADLRRQLAERDAEIERLRASQRRAHARRLGEVFGDWSQFAPEDGGSVTIHFIDLLQKNKDPE